MAKYVLIPGSLYRLYIKCKSNQSADVMFKVYWKYRTYTYQFVEYKSYSFNTEINEGDNEIEVTNDPFLDIIRKDADRTIYGKNFALAIEVYDMSGDLLDDTLLVDFAYVKPVEELSVDVYDAVIRV